VFFGESGGLGLLRREESLLLLGDLKEPPRSFAVRLGHKHNTYNFLDNNSTKAAPFGHSLYRVAGVAGFRRNDGDALRIHDLRHFAASTLTGAGIEDNIFGLLTGHKSRELGRYQHLREELKRKTVDLIAGVLKEAGEGGNNASSSRLLHGGKKRPKEAAPKDTK
jgi:integrase